MPNIDSPKKYHEEVSSAGLFETSLSDADLKKLIDSVPTPLRGVCPISLSTNLPCNALRCQLEKLCDTHQAEMGEGCYLNPSIGGQAGGCLFKHLLRSCPDEVQGCKCSYKSDSTDSRRKKGHDQRRVHENSEGCKKPEWNGRLAVAKLIDAHREGRY